MQNYTIRDFDKEFPNDTSCLEWLRNYLYPDGIWCKECRTITKHHRVTKRRSYSCDRCGHHVHPTAGTIYDHSSTPLKLWFYAIYLMSSTRCGISAKQLQRELGVTYKTAWRIFKQVRSMLTDDGMMLSGQVEVDETYIGGRRPGKRGRGAEGKTPVIGLAQRKGKIVARAAADVSSATILPMIQQHVRPEQTTVFTDELKSYDPLARARYTHERVNHSRKEYVKGSAHTNTLEGFWSLVKQGVRGIYRAVDHKYLQSYLNEYSFRHNHRNDFEPMFKTFLGQVGHVVC